MAVLARGAAYEPVVRALGLAGHGDVAPRLSLQIFGVIPVHGHVFDELEGVHEALIIFGQVGRHLQRAVHRHEEGQLAGQRGVHKRIVLRIDVLNAGLKDARCVIHRAAHEAREGQDGGVERFVTAKRFVFPAASGFVTDQVGIGATEARGAHSLVGVEHDAVLGGLLHRV